MSQGVIETLAYNGPEGTVTKQDCPSGVQYVCSYGGKRHYAGSVKGCITWLKKRRAVTEAKKSK